MISKKGTELYKTPRRLWDRNSICSKK